MRTSTVKKVRIISPRSNEENIIKKIHEDGSLHIEKISDTVLEKDKTAIRGSQKGVEKVSQLLLELSYIKDVSTNIYTPINISALHPKKKVIRRAKSFLDTHKEHIKRIDSSIQKNQEKQERLQNQKKRLKNIPKPFQENQDLILFTSSYKINKENLPETGFTYVEDNKHYYSIRKDSKNKKQIISTFKDNLATRVSLKFIDKTPSNTQKKIEEEIQILKEKEQQYREELKEYVKPLQTEFSNIYAELKNYYDRLTISNNFAATETLLIIEGYAEPKDALRLAKKLNDANVYAENVDNAPTKLKNEGFTKNFQPVTELFDTPRYKKYDPTTFVSFFYPLFFGMMLGDIGYGLLLLSILPFLNSYFKKDIDDYLNILGASAVSTIVFGVLSGSFFGNLVPLEPLLFEPFADSFSILIAALIIGLIHMNIGVGISFYQHSKDNSDAYTIAKDVLPLPLIQVAALTLYMGETALGLALIGTAIILLVAKKGLLGILDVTDYMGTWFSYSRILALSLATAGIALAVNLISQTVGTLGTLGAIIAPLILIGGHIFNFTINTLGCAINAARLHYVEFFSFFFEGGGKPFKAFTLTTPQN